MPHSTEVVQGEFSPNGHFVLTVARSDRQVHLWNAATGLPLGDPVGFSDEVNFATFGSDGHSLVAATGNNGGKTGQSSSWT